MQHNVLEGLVPSGIMVFWTTLTPHRLSAWPVDGSGAKRYVSKLDFCRRRVFRVVGDIATRSATPNAGPTRRSLKLSCIASNGPEPSSSCQSRISRPVLSSRATRQAAVRAAGLVYKGIGR
jgi:hypothetical protein